MNVRMHSYEHTHVIIFANFPLVDNDAHEKHKCGHAPLYFLSNGKNSLFSIPQLILSRVTGSVLAKIQYVAL